MLSKCKDSVKADLRVLSLSVDLVELASSLNVIRSQVVLSPPQGHTYLTLKSGHCFGPHCSLSRHLMPLAEHSCVIFNSSSGRERP